MRRYLPFTRNSRKALIVASTEKPNIGEDDNEMHPSSLNNETSEDTSSTTPLTGPSPLMPIPAYKVKRVDCYYSRWSKEWKFKNSGSKVTPESHLPSGPSGGGKDPWQAFCFVIVRKLPRDPEDADPTFYVVIKSPYLRQACKEVIQDVPGLSWHSEPLELDPQLLLAFLPQFDDHRTQLMNKKSRSTEETHILSTIPTLTEYLRKDYRSTLAAFANLTSHGEITYDLLFALLVPRTILIARCPITGEPRALQLINATLTCTMTGSYYALLCEGIDVLDVPDSEDRASSDAETELRDLQENIGSGKVHNRSIISAFEGTGEDKAFGKVQNRLIISAFKGTVKINSLEAYPIKYHPNEAELRQALVERGRKWVSLKGVHHMQYKGAAAVTIEAGLRKSLRRFNINSRVMIDRATFRRLNPNYEFPVVKQSTKQNPVRQKKNNPHKNLPLLHAQAPPVAETDAELSELELLLATPVIYGFSLSDKLWLEFNVEKVASITWNDEAFKNLVLPRGRKNILQSLVEAHRADLGFDDFVQGKGHGLVINLFGPPGVGKTLSAEATSEHVRRPLYIVGSGDLGTAAAELDASLQRVLDVATSWKAIVLIDEADVFLEERSLHDLERNAMVAVFLRHVEYYRGILFLTTNRVTAFDEAFLSRIHVAMHFQELSKSARSQVWRAFLEKVGVDVANFGDDLLEKLAEREINGRQIKNAMRTANSLAVSRREALGYAHLAEALDAMEEFAIEFKALRRSKS